MAGRAAVESGGPPRRAGRGTASGGGMRRDPCGAPPPGAGLRASARSRTEGDSRSDANKGSGVEPDLVAEGPRGGAEGGVSVLRALRASLRENAIAVGRRGRFALRAPPPPDQR